MAETPMQIIARLEARLGRLERASNVSTGGPPSGAAGGVLGGLYPNPAFAVDMATQAELDAHTGLTTTAHGGIVSSADARLTDARTPTAHETSHEAGGTDALPWTTIHGLGTLAARPAFAATNAGYLYVATDVNGGTLYRSTGAAWSQIAHGVTIAAAEITAGMIAAGGVSVATQIAAGIITDTQVAAANKDGASGTASMRTLGTGAAQATAGNDSRLSDARTPTAHASSHAPGGTDALPWTTIHGSGTSAATPVAAASNAGYLYLATDINNGTLSRSTGSLWAQVAHGVTLANGEVTGTMIAASTITDTNVAAANKDGAAATASLRTLGTGAAQAAAGNDSRLSDARTPTAHATSHAPGGTDALPWTTINGRGTNAARPAAASTNAGYTYQSTDVGGGTLYRSNGTTWDQLGVGLTAAPQSHQSSHQSGGGDALTGNLDATARTNVTKAGVAVGTRRGLNLIEGAGVTLTMADNSGSERVDVTVASTPSLAAAVNATAYRSAALSHTATGNFQIIGLDAELDDTNTMHDSVTNNSRIVVAAGKGGLYLVTGMVVFAANATGARGVDVRKNAAGSTAGGSSLCDERVFGGGGTTNAVPFAFIARLAAADYIEIFGLQSSGGNLAYGVGSNQTFVSLTLVGT